MEYLTSTKNRCSTTFKTGTKRKRLNIITGKVRSLDWPNLLRSVRLKSKKWKKKPV